MSMKILIEIYFLVNTEFLTLNVTVSSFNHGQPVKMAILWVLLNEYQHDSII